MMVIVIVFGFGGKQSQPSLALALEGQPVSLSMSGWAEIREGDKNIQRGGGTLSSDHILYLIQAMQNWRCRTIYVGAALTSLR